MMISDGTPAHRFSQRMRSPAFASVVLIAAQILLASGCGPTRPSLPQPGPAKVTWLSAAERELTDFDEFVGRTEASETVEVRSRVSGFIKSVDFRDGDIVTKGQPLFKIEPDTY
ncbi:MAG: biotin/lipoyl-binding protein, partial [Planctomycetota bacterium]